jgi:hypothetical protein
VGTGNSTGTDLVYTKVVTPQWIPFGGHLSLSGSQGAQIDCWNSGTPFTYDVHGFFTVTRVGTFHS